MNMVLGDAPANGGKKRMHVNVWAATSVDGYVARKDGSIDWIQKRLTTNHDCGMKRFLAAMDCVVLGRRTYERIISFGHWPFKGRVRVYVLSSKPVLFPKNLPDTVRHTRECPQHLVRRLASEGHEQIWLDGAETIQRFLRAGCVDDIVINEFPVLLGDGIRLFGEGMENADISLKLKGTKQEKFGIVQRHYRVVKEKPVEKTTAKTEQVEAD